MKKYNIIVAGGKGVRMNADLPKQFIEIAGRPILMHTIEKFANANADVDSYIVVVLPKSQFAFWADLCQKHNFNVQHDVVSGGRTRFESVKNALALVSSQENSLVAIHDGVRPLVSEEMIQRCFDVAEEKGSAIPVVALVDSVRYVSATGSRIIDRADYRAVQTPQIFRSDILLKAYKQVYQNFYTDDASVVESAGYNVELTDGERQNIKITTPIDLQVAEITIGKGK